MFTLIIVGVACMAIGLYAGKGRAKGLSWFQISCELARGAWDLVASAFEMVARPFRKEKADGDSHDEE